MKKNIFLITTIVLAVLLVGCVAFGFWYDNTYYERTTREIEELNSSYEQHYAELVARYEALSSEKARLEEKLETATLNLDVQTENLDNCKAKLDEANKLLEEVKEERIAENERIKAEEAAYNEWWNSLAEETQQSLTTASERSEAIKYLLANNKEYAEAYNYCVKITLQTTKRTKEQRDTYTKYYSKLRNLENEWLEQKKTEAETDSSGNESGGN